MFGSQFLLDTAVVFFLLGSIRAVFDIAWTLKCFRDDENQ